MYDGTEMNALNFGIKMSKFKVTVDYHILFNRYIIIPIYCLILSTYGGRAFCYAGHLAWNALPDFLKNDTLSLSTFRRQLKHFYFSLY